ncbi:3-phosphoshikimate 1-carboxyvinyltransferase [Desulfosporosinus orientis DSM 765]|uniref:3-phosphoshikimate 1-carboxyvinyltransferase n=1 Tax=Desulfosporosinus orientis (strain ATCC 19365 / DSM 765 / NCIMB 8382 / VKM B-1628 / Singapore I) TaxID=768706 RepID=G7WAN1_DESOD|nr:3-phosphoshikimate 1-carboxyvinyltransferase [Desulfosporosinus orientis]AET66799.1 3-phosphoshikimate 1-carboxyvinyltransferase [Desulfosporosinus orientis DSM 765]
MGGEFIKPIAKLGGQIRVPGDKSISHRAALFGGMAHGETHVTNFLLGQDCLSTLRCLKQLGVSWERKDTEVWIRGEGMESWQEPADVLDAGNSGTTFRLMLGALAGSPFTITMNGDESLRTRPMRRVTDPLKQMGAQIMGRQGDNLAPITMRGGQLEGQAFKTSVASAQIKSAIILAGIRAKGETSVEEPLLSRDHTERMLRGFGVDVQSRNTLVKVQGGGRLQGQGVSVPGDISSAAFFLVLGSLVRQGEIFLPNVGINPTRTGILDALMAMGADIEILDEAEICGEPRATLRVRPAQLRGTEISGDMIPRLIDEIPVLAVAASLAEGETLIKDAAELRVKETDRISTVVKGLQALGVKAEELPDGMRIQGQRTLLGGQASSLGDHRLAMAWAIAGLLSQEGVSVENMAAADVSYPDFLTVIKKVAG